MKDQEKNLNKLLSVDTDDVFERVPKYERNQDNRRVLRPTLDRMGAKIRALERQIQDIKDAYYEEREQIHAEHTEQLRDILDKLANRQIAVESALKMPQITAGNGKE